MISRLNSVIMHVTRLYEDFRINEVPLRIEELFLELSRTYIQLTRDKLMKDEKHKATLRSEGLLTRDPRAKERKKPGLRRARKAPQYTKR